MKKLQLVAALAALGAAAPAMSFTQEQYAAGLLVENVQFHWATNGRNKGWTNSAPNTLTAISNNTFFSDLGGSNSIGYYNAPFAQAGGPGWCPPGLEGFQAQYACRTGGVLPVPAPGDVLAGAKATGSLLVTSTTLTGTLTVINTNDRGAGPQPGTSAATGYNIRTADGSPFQNVWYGISNQMTLTVNLTGTFNPTDWLINGGTVSFADPAFQCGIADFSGVLCGPGQTGSGTGSNLSWGMFPGASGSVGQIPVFDATGATLISTLSGVLANLTVDSKGNLTTIKGETRTGAGSAGGGCATSLRYSAAGVPVAGGTVNLSCGSLTIRDLVITGHVVPVPAAAWLFGSALGLLAVARRKLAA